MEEVILKNFSQIVGKIPEPVTVSAKEVCLGIVGVPLICMIMFLWALNFVMIFYWIQFRERKIRIFGTDFDLLFFLPVINVALATFIFIYAWNAW